MPQRTIIHIDMDAFYASASLRERPDLKGKPVVVAWEGPRSVVCAASYEARRFGLHSAMASTTARRLCPQAVFIPPDFALYRDISAQIHQIFARYTDIIEPLSLDEAYLDVSTYRGEYAFAGELARAIRSDIAAETRLTASAGVAPNKFLAKIASDWRKPDGQLIIAPQNVLRFLKDLPVGKIPGVGKVTEQKMHTLGWNTVGALAKAERQELVLHFGRWGHKLYDLARGTDNSAVKSQRIRKQISQEITLSADEPHDTILLRLPDLAASLAHQLLRRQTAGRCVTLKLKTGNFAVYTRSQTLSSPIACANELEQVAIMLMQRMPDNGESFRLIGLGISALTEKSLQPDLWPNWQRDSLSDTES